MQTKREALLAAYTGKEMPEFIPAAKDLNVGVVFPGDRYFGPEDKGYDAWGVNWTKLGPDPGLDGSMVTPGTEIFEDISDWKEYVHFPDLEAMHATDILKAMFQGIDHPEEKVTHVLMLSGAFERLNQMMGMENALCAFYEDPDALKEFFDAMCEYKLKCITLCHEVLHPDIIHMHDDWGSNASTFFSPEMWREFIKPIEKRYCDHIHSLGMIYEHHSCGFIETLIPDLVEIGVDAINPLNISNHVEQIKATYGDKITLVGGVDNQKLDSGSATEEEIRAEARRVIDTFKDGGRYVPGYIETIAKVRDIFYDEVEKYGKNCYNR